MAEAYLALFSMGARHCGLTPYIRTDKPKPICHHFFKVRGIKTYESWFYKLLQKCKGCITLQENMVLFTRNAHI